MSKNLTLSFVKVTPHKATHFEAIIHDIDEGSSFGQTIHLCDEAGKVFTIKSEHYTSAKDVPNRLWNENNKPVYTNIYNRHVLSDDEFAKGIKALEPFV